MVSVHDSPQGGFVQLSDLKGIDLLEVEAWYLGAELKEHCDVLDEEILEVEREYCCLGVRKEEICTGYELFDELWAI